MHRDRIGYLGYQLYTLGWRHGSHHQLSPLPHQLLKLFLHYRRGFADGSHWVRAYEEELV